MKFKDRIYVSMTRFLPKGYLIYFEKIMRYSGDEENTIYHLGSSLLFSLLIGIIVGLITYYYTELLIPWVILLGMISFLIVQGLYYLIVYFRMEKRADLVEKSLPDQLQLMSNNIKSGMTPFNALKLSARKEFGPLSQEINDAINKTSGTSSFTEVLLDIKSRIRSIMLERVLKLEASSLKTGGNFSHLLNELADDIRETQTLRNDLVTKTKTYMAFILFTILFGTPLLLSISIQFVNLISGFSTMAGTGDVSAGFDIGFMSGGMVIHPDFLVSLSYIILLITTLLASLLLGVINKGKATSGFKYAPGLIIAAVVLFTLSRYLVGVFFGSIL